jgi:hypothetical protein
MSHEHEGPGGMVDLHDRIVDRMAGNDMAKRERVKMLAWSEPKQKRRQLINGILQLNANFIFCFRAKNTSKPVKGQNGRTEVEQLGFMPIAGEEFVFEQTLNALLLPGAGGVPTWQSDQIGERTMIKLPEQFKALANRNAPLDEDVGARLARWAAGRERTKKEETAEPAGEREFVARDAGPAEPPADNPHRAAADALLAMLEQAKDAADLKKRYDGAELDIAALPEELQAEVDQAYGAAQRRLKAAAREAEPVK